MRAIKNSLRPAFALFVIAHGLSHTVLPMRGWMQPEHLDKDFMPVILYGTALLGFTAAGIGLLGLRPFTALTRPLLVVASAYSLVALWGMGHGDLWWGAAVDVVLLLTGLSGAYQYLPAAHESRGRVRHLVGVAAACAFLAYAACAAVLWPIHRTWGSEKVEHALSLPGDEPNRNPALEIQHAVTVNAPPDAVWPWLVQLGQDRAGFYSYDWLERAFGADVHNVLEIRPEWQHRQVGDRVRATQETYLGGLLGKNLGWTVSELEPGQAMVLENWGAFVLLPTEDGKTRFIIRSTIGQERTPVWAAVLDVMTFELPHFIMERRMMLQIKSLAEGGAL
jgi:hypothetical protein